MRIEIMYDFDFESIKYHQKGLNNYPSMRFSGNSEIYRPTDNLGKSDDLDLLFLLGTGLDKLSISESKTNKCLIIEPCPAMFFICSMEQTFEYFITNIKKGKTEIKDGGIYSMENNFRIEGQRPDWIIHVALKLKKIESKWILQIGKIGEPHILEVPFINFLSAYFDFGHRAERFYNYVLPEYVNFKAYENFKKAITESVILQEFDPPKQTSFDKSTFYDYQ